MAWADYTAALDALDVLIAAGDWDGAWDQLALCRTQLARLPESVTVEGGNTLKIRGDQLDELEKRIQQGRSSNRDRFLFTRTNFGTR